MSGREPIRVGVVGLGVIGKRVSAAVQAMPDMALVGAAVRSPSPNVLRAYERGWRLYAASHEAARTLASLGVWTQGYLAELARDVEVVVDCGQRGTALQRSSLHRAAGAKVVYCGGEPLTGPRPDFSTFVSFNAAMGASEVRVASCNATALARVVQPLLEAGLTHVDASIVRCATDPDKANKGVVSSANVTVGPSHHAEELGALFPGLGFHTHAVTVPMVHGHVICARMELQEPRLGAELIGRAPRVEVSLAPTDTFRLLRPESCERVDRHAVTVWQQSVEPTRDSLYFQAHVHMEAVTIPDTVDAIRALAGCSPNAASSATLTDRGLGVIPANGGYCVRSRGSQGTAARHECVRGSP